MSCFNNVEDVGVLDYVYIEGRPVAAGIESPDLMYMTTQDRTYGNFVAANPADGSTAWESNPEPEQYFPPCGVAVGDGSFYSYYSRLGSDGTFSEGGVVEVNASDGTISREMVAPPVTDSRSTEMILLVDRTLYGWQPTAGVYAMDPSDGSVLWNTEVVTDPGSQGPAYRNGYVYIAGGGSTYKLDASDGSVVWEGVAECQFMAVVDGLVLGRQGDSDLYALDDSDGSLAWSYSETNKFYAERPVAVYDGVAYITGTELMAFDASDGAVLWTNDGSGGGGTGNAYDPGRMDGSVVRDGVVYTCGPDMESNMMVTAHDPADGTVLEKYNSPDDDYGIAWLCPVPRGDTLYTGGNGLWAFSMEDLSRDWTAQLDVKYSTPVGETDGWSYCNQPGRAGNAEPITEL